MSEEGRGATIDSPEWLRQMECVLETLNEGVLIADDSDRVLFVNAVFEEMTGFSRREIIGKHAGQAYYAPEDFTVIHALRQKARETGRSRQEFFLPTKSGERLPVVISARSVEEPGGRRFAIVTATDISEQKRAQQDLRTVNAQLEARHQEIEQDLILAARIQQSLAPKSLVWGALRVEAFYRPVRTIGGDFGLVSPLDERHLNLMVCDVSGHGISSALIANRIYSETITQLHRGAPLGEILHQLNRFVMHHIGSPVFLFTLAAARVDGNCRRMVFAGAGHPPAMVVQPGAEPRLVESRSMALGAVTEAVGGEATVEVALEPGDRIVLYTDGITDVFDSHGQRLGVEGVREFVRQTSLLPFNDMQQGLLDRVAAWSAGPASDDVSLVLVEVR
ncbi:MAG TPA: SpoIIE family protein phosphatase [Terriglobia bacterium]|nr:SpoIIE family protein phosphatase [Terriglobia bacterium]